jgi:hypothetical protein
MRQRLQIVNSNAKRPGPFARIEDAVAAIRAGKMVIVVDDEDRENEGDLTIAAEKITPEVINFMARYGRGLVCLAMTPSQDLPFRGYAATAVPHFVVVPAVRAISRSIWCFSQQLASSPSKGSAWKW